MEEVATAKRDLEGCIIHSIGEKAGPISELLLTYSHTFPTHMIVKNVSRFYW
jgi:hypothetical protein